MVEPHRHGVLGLGQRAELGMSVIAASTALGAIILVPSTVISNRVAGTATATVALLASGVLTRTTDLFGTVSSDLEWMNPNSWLPTTNFQVRLTVNSGATPSGSATGTWLTLSTDRTWTNSQTGAGSVTSNVTIEVRDIASTNVIASMTFDLTATVLS